MKLFESYKEKMILESSDTFRKKRKENPGQFQETKKHVERLHKDIEWFKGNDETGEYVTGLIKKAGKPEPILKWYKEENMLYYDF